MRRQTSFAPTRHRRSPVPAILLTLLALLIAFLVFLGASSNEAPLERIEQDVINDVAGR